MPILARIGYIIYLHYTNYNLNHFSYLFCRYLLIYCFSFKFDYKPVITINGLLFCYIHTLVSILTIHSQAISLYIIVEI